MIGTKSKKNSMNLALEELRRREELESLRPYLINEQCFPSFRDPTVSQNHNLDNHLTYLKGIYNYNGRT